MESRDDGESRGGYYPTYTPTRSYSRGEYDSYYGEYDEPVKRLTKEEKEVKMIDDLISRLDYQPSYQTESIRSALNERQQKMEELKQLREVILKRNREQEELKRIKQNNTELDKLIRSLRKST